MNRKRNGATIYDIAAEADVSPTTVSRVLSNSAYSVSDELRRRVLEVAERLHYSARGKMQVGAGDVIVVVPNLSNLFYTDMISGLETALSMFGLNMILRSTHGDLGLEKQYIRELCGKKGVRLIIAPVTSELEHLTPLIQANIPLVLLEQPPLEGCATIYSDNRLASEMLVEYLVQNNHRRIAYLGMALTRPTRTDVYNGYCGGLSRAGIPVDSSLGFFAESEPDPWNNISPISTGMHLADRLLKSGIALPDAVLCSNDMLAIGALKRFGEAGLRIPRDLSLVSMDNIVLSEISSPALTTIDFHTYELGKNCAEMLYQQITDPDCQKRHITTMPELIVRESVRPL